MTQTNNQNQQNNQKNNQKGGAGGGARVFIALPKGKPVFEEVSGKKGFYTVNFRLGQTHSRPTHDIAVKVYANDHEIGDVYRVLGERECSAEAKLDFKEPIVLSVRRAGFRDEKPWDSLAPVSLPAKAPKPKAGENKRMKIFVGQLTPSRKNPIDIYTYNEAGEPENASVIIEVGQEGFVDDEPLTGSTLSVEVTTGETPFKTGHGAWVIRLNECDGLVTFRHESGESQTEPLLKEP